MKNKASIAIKGLFLAGMGLLGYDLKLIAGTAQDVVIASRMYNLKQLGVDSARLANMKPQKDAGIAEKRKVLEKLYDIKDSIIARPQTVLDSTNSAHGVPLNSYQIASHQIFRR